MEGRSSTAHGSRGERIRGLGFDPRHLTPEEQKEILELNARFARGAAEAGGPPRNQGGGVAPPRRHGEDAPDDGTFG